MGRDAKTVSPPTRIAAIPFKKMENGEWKIWERFRASKKVQQFSIFNFQ